MTGDTKGVIQTGIIDGNRVWVAGNYDCVVKTWGTSSASTMINATKDQTITGYIYCSANITSGENFSFKIYKLKSVLSCCRAKMLQVNK